MTLKKTEGTGDISVSLLCHSHTLCTDSSTHQTKSSKIIAKLKDWFSHNN